MPESIQKVLCTAAAAKANTLSCICHGCRHCSTAAHHPATHVKTIDKIHDCIHAKCIAMLRDTGKRARRNLSTRKSPLFNVHFAPRSMTYGAWQHYTRPTWVTGLWFSLEGGKGAENYEHIFIEIRTREVVEPVLVEIYLVWDFSDRSAGLY